MIVKSKLTLSVLSFLYIHILMGAEAHREHHDLPSTCKVESESCFGIVKFLLGDEKFGSFLNFSRDSFINQNYDEQETSQVSEQNTFIKWVAGAGKRKILSSNLSIHERERILVMRMEALERKICEHKKKELERTQENKLETILAAVSNTLYDSSHDSSVTCEAERQLVVLSGVIEFGKAAFEAFNGACEKCEIEKEEREVQEHIENLRSEAHKAGELLGELDSVIEQSRKTRTKTSTKSSKHGSKKSSRKESIEGASKVTSL